MSLLDRPQGEGTHKTENKLYEIEAELGFAPLNEVEQDQEFPDRLRLPTHPISTDPLEVFDFHTCKIRDCSGLQGNHLHLQESGFETLDLSHLNKLQNLLAGINVAGYLSTGAATQLRRLLRGQTFRLNNGKRLHLLYVAPEGLILRQAGPNGLRVSANKKMTDTSGHEGAMVVHGDQDILGTPLKQILRGLAPWLFAHEAPYSHNRKSPLRLVNVWIPLQQLVRPLTLMDRKSLDLQRHQIRYALPIDSFLERDEGQKLNDIWLYLYDQQQQWYFSAGMDHKHAYVFDTLGTPHSAFISPGEAVAEFYYLHLQNLRQGLRQENQELIERTLRAVTTEVAPDLPEDIFPALTHAIHQMKQCLEEAVSVATNTTPQLKDEIWQTRNRRAEQAMARVVRRSIEMRVVALVLP